MCLIEETVLDTSDKPFDFSSAQVKVHLDIRGQTNSTEYANKTFVSKVIQTDSIIVPIGLIV